MRTTPNMDDAILRKASRLTGVKEKATLVLLGLEALIAREITKKFAWLGGAKQGPDLLQDADRRCGHGHR